MRRNDEQEMASDEIASHLLKRARLFCNALTSLYASAALLAAGSVIGALMSMLGQAAPDWLVIGFASAGIVSLIVAMVLLVRESTLSLTIIEAHVIQLLAGYRHH